jgi:hypothetical protein
VRLRSLRLRITTPQLSPPSTCEDTLEFLQRIGPRCPAAFTPLADVAEQACGDGSLALSLSSSERYTSLWYLYGAGQTECVYEASGSALIGIWKSDDSNYFCNGTSFDMQAGEVDIPAVSLTRIDCNSFRPPMASAPSPTPVACPGGPNPSVLTTDRTNRFHSFTLGGTDVYWADPSYGIFRRTKTGGDFEALVSDRSAASVSIVDSTLYWSNAQGIFSQPLEGGAESPPLAPDASGPWSVSGDNIYYIADVGHTLVTQLKSAPLNGDAPAVLAQGPWWSNVLTADATGVYWFMVPQDLHLDPRLQKYDFATGAIVNFAPPQGDVRFLQIAGQHVLWIDDSGIWSSTADGSERILLAQPPRVQALGSDGTDVYWAQGAVDDHVSDAALFSDVFSVPLTGGQPRTVACHAYSVRSLRADDSAVYYDSTVSDVLVRVPKTSTP